MATQTALEVPLAASTAQLFQPLRVGPVTLRHRVALAPLTRFRAQDDHTPSDLAKTYYTQRASTPGTLMITEATFISARAGGYKNAPGIYNEKHVAGWRRITDAIHAHRSFLFVQLWALGRTARAEVLEAEPEGPFNVVSASATQLDEKHAEAKPLTKEEIKEWVNDYAAAAQRSLEAGADGVEIHGANGYLIDQFLQDKTNFRTDEYGGSIENRTRFALEVIKAVVDRVGEEKVGIRLSPYGVFQGMGEKDPIPLFSYLVRQIRDLYPRFAYIHVVSSRVAGVPITVPDEDVLRQIWQEKDSSRVFLTAGGYDRAGAIEEAKNDSTVAVWGRHFISNPDLPLRLKYDAPLEPYDSNVFYGGGEKGYVTYGSIPQLAEAERAESKL